MKVKDLIKQIEEYPDYELELTNVVVYESKQRPDYNNNPDWVKLKEIESEDKNENTVC